MPASRKIAKKVAIAIVVSACLLTSFARAQVQSSPSSYASPRQAYEAFEKSEDAVVRAEAFGWMKECALAKTTTALLSEPLLLLSKMAVELGKDADFEAVCAERIQENDPAITSFFAPKLSDWYAGKGDYEKAISALTVNLKPEINLTPSQMASFANKAALILSAKMFRYADAVEILSNTINSVSTKDPGAFASLANTQSSILRNNLANPVAAEALTREVLALGDLCPGLAYATASDQLASMLREKGDQEGALVALMQILKHPSLPPSGIAQKIISAGASPAEIEESLLLLRRRMAQMPTDVKEFRSRIEKVQPEVVEFLMALGRRDEAVRECRVLIFSASDKVYPLAIELTAKILRKLDGNLGRVNALLGFQSADDGVTAKQDNVLFDFPILDDAVRTESYAALAPAEKLEDWNAWLLRSAYFLWLDRLVEAIDAAATAFTVCPLSESTLQTCAAATVRPILVATRDSTTAQTVIDYMLFGAMGRDGKSGTDDDMTDPFPSIRAKLAFRVVSDLATQP